MSPPRSNSPVLGCTEGLTIEEAAGDTMQQNATLSDGQERALASLLAGKTVTTAAADAGIDRTTLHRWLKSDFAFQASLNRGRRELRDAMQARLLALAEKAGGVVETALNEGDRKTAMDILRGLGLLTGEPGQIGSDDALELAHDAEQSESLRKLLSR